MNNEEWEFTHKDDQTHVNEKISELIRGDKPRNLSVNRNYTKDGRILHCEWYNSVMFDSSGEIVSIFSLVHDISDRIEKEKELEASLKEKNILLAEIHHRVKNNLAVVSGMMQLQAFETDNETLQGKLFDSVVRIKSIASVHEILYQSNSFSDLNFSETVEKLVENISSTLQTTIPVEISYDTDPINLDINKAIPAALVINEVVTNAYKHAFTNKKQGKISFKISDTNGSVEIIIQDNGKGIEHTDLENNQSLGMQLIREISSQIYGQYTYRKGKNGTEFRLTFER
jgi:two-component sensor histidine kinase